MKRTFETIRIIAITFVMIIGANVLQETIVGVSEFKLHFWFYYSLSIAFTNFLYSYPAFKSFLNNGLYGRPRLVKTQPRGRMRD